jgi:hypothetical protein
MKVFSFSLFGNNPIYTIGTIKNVELINSLFPEWKIYVYTNKVSSDPIILELLKKGVNIRYEEDTLWFNSAWRFKAITEESVEVMVCRDSDSRISERDVASISEWLHSDYNYHIIRDHPIGHHWVMNAGMWGAKKNNFIEKIDVYLNEYLTQNQQLKHSVNFDQLFLRDVIYQEIKNDSMIHDEYYGYESHSKPIEHDRKSNDFAFIGESIDENDQPRGDQRSPIIERYVK